MILGHLKYHLDPKKPNIPNLKTLHFTGSYLTLVNEVSGLISICLLKVM